VALDNRIQILDALSGKPTVQQHTTSGEVRRLAFSPNDNYVGATTPAGAVELWSPVSQSARTLSQDGTTMTAFAFNPTGEVIVTGSGDGLVRTWDTASGDLMQTVAKFEQQEGGVTPLTPISDLSLSPDGLTLEISRSNGQQQQLSFTAGEPRVAHTKDGSGRISFANDRSLLALEANGGNLFRSGLRLPVNVSTDVVAFSLDGNRFAAVAHGTTVKIWDVGYPATVNSNKQPNAANNQPDKNMPDVIGQAIASLTDGLGSPDDCKNEICTELRASVPDIAEGNRLAKLGEINRALAKFASAGRRTSWLRGNSNVEDWARKEVQFIQDKATADFSSQKQKGQLAQAQFMLRAGSGPDSVPQTVPGIAAISAALLKQSGVNATGTLFRSAAYSAAKQEDEQHTAAWLARAREIAPSNSGTKDNPDAEASQLIVGILVGEAGNALSAKNIVRTLDYIAGARKYQQQIPVDADAVFNNELCWDATISEGNFFKDHEVIESCNRAAVLSKGNPAFLDSLAVNLARHGNYADAIKNFLPYVNDPKSPQDRKSLREGWIVVLQKGQDPFTPDVLKQMQRGW
jgi:hypothetical protein